MFHPNFGTSCDLVRRFQSRGREPIATFLTDQPQLLISLNSPRGIVRFNLRVRSRSYLPPTDVISSVFWTDYKMSSDKMSVFKNPKGKSDPFRVERVNALSAAEIAQAARMMAHTYDESPMFCSAFANPEQRYKAASAVFSAVLRDALRFGIVFLARDAQIIGAFMVYPPGTYPITLLRKLRLIRQYAQIAAADLKGLLKMMSAEKTLVGLHPPEPHLYGFCRCRSRASGRGWPRNPQASYCVGQFHAAAALWRNSRASRSQLVQTPRRSCLATGRSTVRRRPYHMDSVARSDRRDLNHAQRTRDPGMTAPYANAVNHEALAGSVLDFARPRGPDLLQRTQSFHDWARVRRDALVWPFHRSLDTPPMPHARGHDDCGRALTGMNFGSQDYLGLSQHPAVHQAAAEALSEWGPHSASSRGISRQH